MDEQIHSRWVEVRNTSGHLLFLYDPFANIIEIKKGGIVYDHVRLDEIREKHGIIPVVKKEPLDVVEVSNKIA